MSSGNSTQHKSIEQFVWHAHMNISHKFFSVFLSLEKWKGNFSIWEKAWTQEVKSKFNFF